MHLHTPQWIFLIALVSVYFSCPLTVMKKEREKIVAMTTVLPVSFFLGYLPASKGTLLDYGAKQPSCFSTEKVIWMWCHLDPAKKFGET